MLIAATIAILVVMLMAITRGIMGPTLYDRILAVNMFGTKTVLLISLLGFVMGRPEFLDIAIVYALINFISVIAVLRYSDTAIFKHHKPSKKEHGEELIMDTLMSVSSAVFLLIGAFLCISGGVGILRFPDFYTRMHAVGVTETLATAMILIGLMLQNPTGLVVIKLIMILLMTLLISPTASHALAKAAMHNGLMPEIDSQADKAKVRPSKP